MSEVSYPLILTEGGDDRLVLNAKGVNKYHCRPEVSKPVLRVSERGSFILRIMPREASE